MALDEILGWATSEIPNFSGYESLLVFTGLILVWVIILIVINFILFLISIAKHDISLKQVWNNAMESFKANFGSFFKYYIIIIVLSILFVVTGVWLPAEPDSVGSLGLGLLMLPLLFFFGVYYFMLDTSLAKSYYHSKKSPFVFTWISWGQAGKLFAVGILYFFMMLFSLLLLGIPIIFLGFMIPFVRYPIIVEDTGVMESIKRGFGMLKKEFWNIVFFVSIYGFVVTILNSVFGQIPYINQIVSLATLVFVQPFGTMLITEVYFQTEQKYLKDSAKASKPKKDEIQDYVNTMREQGFSNEQIKEAMMESGYAAAGIRKYLK